MSTCDANETIVITTVLSGAKQNKKDSTVRILINDNEDDSKSHAFGSEFMGRFDFLV